MSTNTHLVAPEEIMALLDGELSAADAQAVSAHLDHCAECTNLAEQFRSTSQSLSHWNVQAIPPKLGHSLQDLAAQTRAGLKIGKPNIFIRASFWTWKQWMLGLASAIATLLVLAFIATPSLMRSRLAPSEAVAVGRQRTLQAQRESSARGSLGKLAVDGQPITDQQSKVFQNQIVAQKSPGIAADSNGLFHGLGDHAQNSYYVDGRPISDQEARLLIGPMIARTVSLAILVKDFEKSRASLDAILARHSGYSAQVNVSTPQGAARSLQASLRIPAPQLTAAIAELKSLGRVENEAQNGEEVTQQHADLVARLKNSRETEQRLQAILLQRTGKISDVLSVEQEIARVRGEIEQMEAEQNSLEHRVDFASIDLNLSEEYKAQLNPPSPSISTRLHNALVTGYRDAFETVIGIVLFFAAYGPSMLVWLLVLLPIALILWRRWRRSYAMTASLGS